MGVLRVFFALCVVSAHCGFSYFLSAPHAVECFYIISGFYMSLILNEKYYQKGQNLVFYKKRFLRIMPGYWLFWISSFIVSYACFTNNLGSPDMLFNFDLFSRINTNFFTTVYLFFSNIFVFGTDLSMFTAIDPNNGSLFFVPFSYMESFPLIRFYAIQVSWSIALEFTFYLIAPFILRGKKKLVVVLFFTSLFLKFYLRKIGLNDDNWTFRFFPSELCMFCLGYFAYLAYKTKKHLLSKKILFFLPLLLFAPFYQQKYMVCFPILSILLLLTLPVLFENFKSNKFDRKIGDLSYLIYLIHPLIIAITHNVFRLTGNILFITTCILSILIAYLCNNYILDIFERKRNMIK